MSSSEVCRICGGNDWGVLYRGPIRVGRFGNLSAEEHTVWKCASCLAGFLPGISGQTATYYESTAYREEVDGGAEAADYFRLHDGEQASNLAVTGTAIFRDKIVVDVGCGGGSFLDAVKGFAREAVAVEPSRQFRQSLAARGYAAYAYMRDALTDYRGQVDVITSYSVLEHVEDPLGFLQDIRDLLAPNGKAFLSTPNRADILLEALPKDYPSFFYRKAHRWYFDAEAMRNLLERGGFGDVRIIPRQRFGLSNFLGWMRDASPLGHRRLGFVTEAMDSTWKAELERTLRCDYLYVEGGLRA